MANAPYEKHLSIFKIKEKASKNILPPQKYSTEPERNQKQYVHNVYRRVLVAMVEGWMKFPLGKLNL